MPRYPHHLNWMQINIRGSWIRRWSKFYSRCGSSVLPGMLLFRVMVSPGVAPIFASCFKGQADFVRLIVSYQVKSRASGNLSKYNNESNLTYDIPSFTSKLAHCWSLSRTIWIHSFSPSAFISHKISSITSKFGFALPSRLLSDDTVHPTFSIPPISMQQALIQYKPLQPHCRSGGLHQRVSSPAHILLPEVSEAILDWGPLADKPQCDWAKSIIPRRYTELVK